MLPEDRKGLILRELAMRGSLNAAEFAAKAGISGMTVRRDLATLAEQGLLVRVHGGAVAAAESAPGPQRNTKTSRTRRLPLATIGMVVPSASYYFPGVIRGAEAAAQEAGVRLVLGVSNYSVQEEQRQLRRLLDNGVDGILVTPSEAALGGTDTLALLAGARVPVVVVERSIEDALDDGELESVRSDHVRGAEIAVNHLLSLGHRKVALCIREGSPTAAPVVEGYHLALRRAGMPHDESLVRALARPRSDPAGHRAAVEGLLDRYTAEGVTAAIIHTDEDALQFTSACQERRLRVPEDFAIVAYDDEIAALGAVALSAVAPPKFDVGYQALLMCLNRIGGRRGGTGALQRVSLSPTLVVRDSSRV
ncbi:substrate-binding domain-containing protein [Arthrobacter sp. R-11]|uniref:LacI family DNA-binding transcriptional regulator n=1 Tax=Arthrobacter sp. R-11 TaxID=3404053 RepID=UPI003CEF607E